MSFFPSPVLVRLQELKLWQGNYDSVLKNKSKVNGNPSDAETIEGVSALDSFSSPLSSPERENGVDWDKKTISPTKTFEQLLEEKLAQDRPSSVQAKPKKPFLRKGAGLSRYKGGSNNVKRPIRKAVLEEKITSSEKTDKRKSLSAPIKPKSCLKKKKDPKIDLTPLKMPDLAIKPKASWHKVLENESSNVETGNLNPAVNDKSSDDFKTPKNHFNSHIIGKINEFALRHFLPHNSKKKTNLVDYAQIQSENIIQNGDVHETTTENELRIFETLEERVENSSFSSTNSSIVRLLSSTPNKIKKPELKSPILEEDKFIPKYPFGDQKAINLQQKLQEVNKKSDVLHDFLKNLRKMGGHNDKKKKSKESLQSDSSKSNEKLQKQTPETSFDDEEKWSSNTDSNTRSPTPLSFYTDFEATCKGDYSNCVDAAVNTSFKDYDETTVNEKCSKCKELERKLEKLHNAVPDIKAEKAKVMDFAKELEKKRDLMTVEMQKLRKDYEEELRELRCEFEVERKKFAREKMVFDTHIKDAHNRPTRKEREEISNLKKEVSDVKELLKLKDAKNGSTQARLRNQIKQLEKDNLELKTSIEKLQKENSKLAANQSLRRPSESKMLHEINKNLSKLAEEAFKKQVTKSVVENEASNIAVKQAKSERDCRNKENDEEKEILPKVAKKQSCLKTNILDDVSANNAINETCGHDITSFANVSLEKQYENVFGHFLSPGTNNSLNDSKKEKSETIFEDGSREIKYSNGNTKTISPDRNLIIVRYYNGDIKETNLRENTLKYYYAENSTWHTQFGDGLELLEYANGQREKKYKDGKSEIACPDGSFITKMPDGTEEVLYRDGSKLIKNLAGDRILLLPNGQKEIHTKEHKRREYPDGTVKILYPDGTQETRYSSGRVRIKDSKGALIVDSQNSD